ncbi:MAG: MarR family transcriptional regulator [Burkholderiaceae bacterium]|nr:MarR family transcriptional regulator [Burkholderiaceae bacterium]
MEGPAGRPDTRPIPTGDPDTPPIDYGMLRDAIGYQLRLAEVAMLQTFARRFAGTGITPARLTALELIDRNPGIRPATLARAMVVETSNLSTLLRQLEAGGLIEARRGPDRRSKALHLTPRARARMTGLRRRLSAQDRDLGQGLSADERESLTYLLGKLVGSDGRTDGTNEDRAETRRRIRSRTEP